MPRSKSINLFLMDGEPTGKIKCSLANWTGVAYKIPRSMLDSARSIKALNQTGVYMLFGADPETGDSAVYIGQAVVRKNGEGVVNRWMEHERKTDSDWWTEAVVLTTSNDILGPTDISYLENRLRNLAVKADRYIVRNGNEPNPGNVTEEKESELDEFLYYARLIVGTLNYKVFEPLVSSQIVPDVSQSDPVRTSDENVQEGELMRCTVRGADARGRRTPEGFVVLAGSRLASTLTSSAPGAARKAREKYADRISDDYILQKDTLFNSPSGAAGFAGRASLNGNREWVSETGISLGDLEAEKVESIGSAVFTEPTES